MNTRLRTIAPLIAAAALVAAPAGAEVIAGWDFSQYRGSATLAPVGASSLPANYSSLDPTGNAGAESAAFGTCYFDGSNGSTSTATDFLPTAGSRNCYKGLGGPRGCAEGNADGPVRSNKTEPWGKGENSFDSGAHLVQRDEGQTFQNLLAMTATNDVSVVFGADLTSLGEDATNWAVSFGGRTAAGAGPDGGELRCSPACSATVGVDFSVDGSTYASIGSVNLTPEDERFEVPLGAVPTDTAFVRLNLHTSDGTPIIDNVAISGVPLPEPGATLQLLAGLGGLMGLRRLRRTVG
jgi:hypothetical protein